MPKSLILPTLLAGFLAFPVLAATAAPTLRPATQTNGVSAALTRVDWYDHCDWRCREHRRWEHEREEAHRRWEQRHDHY